ncbi:MAG: hypothetical protein ACJ741_02555 [Pyrinomonadaceae bacterium]
MQHSQWKRMCALVAALVLGSLFVVWRAQGQDRPGTHAQPQQRAWEYSYDSASNSFPTDADKIKMKMYGDSGWELTAAVRGQYVTTLVFKRPKLSGN